MTQRRPEYRKHNPDNLRPEWFLAPPRVLLRSKLMSLVQRDDVAGFRPHIRLGTELEFAIFSSEVDPDKAQFMPPNANPNYAPKHAGIIKFLQLTLQDMAQTHSALFMGAVSSIGRISFEVRSQPCEKMRVYLPLLGKNSWNISVKYLPTMRLFRAVKRL